MPRTTLNPLITRLRRLVGDRAGASQAWSNDELADYLDTRRQDVTDLLLEGEPSSGPGSALQFLTWKAPWGDWEADAVLKDVHFNEVTADDANYLNGIWTFGTEPSYPVYLTGKTFDLYGVAADVLEMGAAGNLDNYDFRTADGQSFSRSQMFDHRERLVRLYRSKQRPQLVQLVRSDVETDTGLTNLKVLRR